MLDDYQKEQPVAYKILINSVKKNRCSHAYLFETKHYINKNSFVLAFAKYLLCPFHYSNRECCNDCHQCQRIDEGNFTELKIIEPDGSWIKKEQIDILQKEFSTKSVESSKKVYIINGADKMNTSAANSILKFLEEPEEDIIAILVTDNIYQLLNTIISRCQVIPLVDSDLDDETSTLKKIATLIKHTNEEIETFITDEKSTQKLDTVVNFVKEYEKVHQEVLLSMKELWFDTFSDKDKIIDGLELMMYFYYDILNYQIENKIEIFFDYLDDIKQLSNKLNLSDICNRLNVIIDLKGYLKTNANINLLMDKLIIEMERRRKYD